MSPTPEELAYRLPSCPPSEALKQSYDAVVVGAGPVGCALAYSLGQSGRKILVLERDLSFPDRIVGEFLQPGGCASLHKLGMLDCLNGIDSRLAEGYAIFWGDRQVDIPYPQLTSPQQRLPFGERGLSGQDNNNSNQIPEPNRFNGRSFHFGRFVTALRKKAATCPNVTFVEATVNHLVSEDDSVSSATTGVSVTPSDKAVYASGQPRESSKQRLTFNAPLILIVDGSSSKFRRIVLPKATPIVRSNFVALILKDAPLPSPARGHVFLARDSSNGTPQAPKDLGGPVLVYQLSEHDTRMLVDVPGAKLPSIANGDLKRHLEKHVLPVLPLQLHACFLDALNSDRLRSMPNSFLPAYPQHRAPLARNVLLVGDALNMRHPLTGGGMTVGLSDVVMLSNLLGGPLKLASEDVIDFEHDKEALLDAAETWYWERKQNTATINVLAQALYSLFSAADENLDILKVACFKYFERGGKCISEPISLLGGLCPSPWVLFYHFFSVAFFAIYLLFTKPAPGSKLPPSPLQWPALTLRSFGIIWTACVVFLPVIYSEMRF